MKIGFIGAGKVGKALGFYYLSHGLDISGYYSRSAESAREAAELTGSREFPTIEAVARQSGIVFITVPDQAIGEIDREAAALIEGRIVNAQKIWIHVSGAHPSDCLAGIKAAGCPVGSMHPLQSFGEPEESAERLNSAWFTIEGAEKAVWAATGILVKTNGNYSLIKAKNKPLYHAGACVISNFLVTLMESGIRYFERAGMERGDIAGAIGPLIDATLSNIREKGTTDALTGPIVRGDYNTVSVHMKAIKTLLPSELDFYKAMAEKTAEMLDGNRLTHGQAEKFKEILEDTPHVG